MDTTTEKVTDRQRALLNKLMLSSTFTAKEAHRTSVWLDSPGATKDKATEVIDRALERIKDRDSAKKDSAARKAEYHATKGEYPPRRYSNENPPAPAPTPAPAPPEEQEQTEQKVYIVNGVEYTDGALMRCFPLPGVTRPKWLG